MSGQPVWLAATAAALAVWLFMAPAGVSRLASSRSAGRETLDVWGRLRTAARAPAYRWLPAERRRRTQIAAEVADVCTLLAVCLDAGRPPRAALRIVVTAFDGPTHDLLADVLARIDLGMPEREAWAALAQAPGYAAIARDVGRAVDSGLHLADTLRDHARDARRQRSTAALVRARTAGVRSVVPLMLCFLPAFLLLGVVPLFGAVVAGMAW